MPGYGEISSWTSVTYGDGAYAAFGYSPASMVAHSTDAITWATVTLPVNKQFKSVAHGDGKFAAAGWSSANAIYSTDAISWSQATLPTSDNWHSITYGGGKFVAVSVYSTSAAYSTDAITWTAATLPSSGWWRSVTHGDGKFVAVNYSSSTGDGAAHSTDGITWTAATLSTPANSITYGNGKFVTNMDYSTDAITWTQIPTPARGQESVAYGNGKFLASGAYYYDTAYYSTDAITWTQTAIAGGGFNIWEWSVISGGDANYQEVVYTAPQTIYTVPSSTEAIVSSIFISNTSTTTDTYNFAVVPSGETLSDIHYIRKNTDIVAKDFHNIDTKITMSAGDSLVALSGSADKLNINVFGVEKS